MKAYDPRRPLYSIHVPKSAGISFQEVLRGWFGDRLLLHYQDDRLNKPPERHHVKSRYFPWRYRRSLCIHGHFNNFHQWGTHHYYPGADQFITILRDPFEVHLSYYFYVKQLGSNAYIEGQPHPIITHGWDVETFLKLHPKSYILAFLPEGLTLDNFEEVLAKNFLYIGITEDLQTSVDCLAARLGQPSVKVPQLNKAKRDDPVPEHLREEFARNNPLETAIYEFARDRYRLAG